MFTYPNIDPIALQLGPLKIHWYGLMYVVGIGSAWLLALYRAKKSLGFWTNEKIADMIFYCALGVVIGGRLGYVLFYGFQEVMQNPLYIFKVWEGGMSFHGGLIGVCLAIILFAKRNKQSIFAISDFIAPMVPIGLGAGRVGNFINGELWGRVTNVPWAMIYPHVDSNPRHPSEIYEMLFEGLFLFLILWIYSSKPRPRMAVSGLFLLCYGVFRFSLEFLRQPDPQLGFIAMGWMTMGQLLSIPMILFGIVILILAYQRAADDSATLTATNSDSDETDSKKNTNERKIT